MRVPQAPLVQKLSRFIVIFIIGMLVGSLIFLYMHGKMMDKLLSENLQLSYDNNNLSEENEKLEEEISKRTKQKLVIKKMDIKTVKDGQEKTEGFTELEVLDRLRQDLKFLIDLPLESVAETAESILQLINGKKYMINQQEVGLHVEALVIYTTLTVKVSIHPII